MGRSQEVRVCKGSAGLEDEVSITAVAAAGSRWVVPTSARNRSEIASVSRTFIASGSFSMDSGVGVRGQTEFRHCGCQDRRR